METTISVKLTPEEYEKIKNGIKGKEDYRDEILSEVSDTTLIMLLRSRAKNTHKTEDKVSNRITIDGTIDNKDVRFDFRLTIK